MYYTAVQLLFKHNSLSKLHVPMSNELWLHNIIVCRPNFLHVNACVVLLQAIFPVGGRKEIKYKITGIRDRCFAVDLSSRYVHRTKLTAFFITAFRVNTERRLSGGKDSIPLPPFFFHFYVIHFTDACSIHRSITGRAVPMLNLLENLIV